MPDTVPGSGDLALLLVSCWWGQSGRDREGLRDQEGGHPGFFLWEACPDPPTTFAWVLEDGVGG